MPALLIAALLVTGGASVAAEGALPGDVLYTVKTGVNEEVRDVLAVSDRAQANWDVQKIERRLQEAEKLAVQGGLTTETSTGVEARFENHLNAFQKRVEKLEEKQDRLSALEARSSLEAAIDAHEKVLAFHLFTDGTSTTTRENINSILSRVRSQGDEIDNDRERSEAEITVDVSAKTKAAAEGKFGAAQNKIAAVERFMDKRQSKVAADVFAEAQADLEVAQEFIIQGEEHLEEGSFGRAFISFQNALRTAQQAKITIAAASSLEKDKGDAEEDKERNEEENEDVENDEEEDEQENEDEEDSDKDKEEEDSQDDTATTSVEASAEVNSEAEVKNDNGRGSAETRGRFDLDFGF